jgi:hypothetical protein
METGVVTLLVAIRLVVIVAGVAFTGRTIPAAKRLSP